MVREPFSSSTYCVFGLTSITSTYLSAVFQEKSFPKFRSQPFIFTWCWDCFLLGIKMLGMMMSGVVSGTEMPGLYLSPIPSGFRRYLWRMEARRTATCCYKRRILAKFHLVFSYHERKLHLWENDSSLKTSLRHEDNPRRRFGVVCLLHLECHREGLQGWIELLRVESN